MLIVLDRLLQITVITFYLLYQYIIIHFLEAYNDLCKNSSSLLEVDVCQFKGLCKNGRCTNTGNSFRCDCDAGFGVDETGTMCLDYDECKITTGICGPGQCMNTHGSFRCKCNNGYRNAMMMEMCVGELTFLLKIILEISILENNNLYWKIIP